MLYIKKISGCYTTIFFILCLFISISNANSKKITIHFFGSATCGECKEIEELILNPLSSTHNNNLVIKHHYIENEEDFTLLDKMEKAYKVKNPSPQELFLPDTVLLGFENIMTNGNRMIEERLKNPSKHTPVITDVKSTNYKEVLLDRFKSFTFIGILTAGLVDGINPCAIATMIFLISFLAMKKRKRSEILLIGLCFTASVFVAYLLLGIGAFKVLTSLQQYHLVSKITKWFAVSFAGVISLISFADAFSYKKSGKSKDIKLQLPKVLKLKIHRIISANLSGRKLIIGSITTGFLVTILEAVCTGQVYLPTIILMTRHSGLKLTGWLYLLFYNFLFVLPLLIVMIMGYYGMTWNKLSKFSQKHLFLLKILLGLILGLLATFLAATI